MDMDVKSSPARAAAKTSAPATEKFVEVEMIRKYVPHHCYTLDADSTIAILEKDKDGNPILQRNVQIGEAQDKFGRAIPVMREVLHVIPPGVVAEIPSSEARKLINEGKARISARSFE